VGFRQCFTGTISAIYPDPNPYLILYLIIQYSGKANNKGLGNIIYEYENAFYFHNANLPCTSFSKKVTFKDARSMLRQTDKLASANVREISLMGFSECSFFVNDLCTNLAYTTVKDLA
jgi:hypothetical protein